LEQESMTTDHSPLTTHQFDVLGLGCVALDELLYVPAYPAPDTKVRVRRRERQCGGLAATALVAAARQGAACAYAGTLGDDDDSRFVIDAFHCEGIDTSLLRRHPEARPIRSFIVVDETQQTRTIIFDIAGAVPAQVDWPPEEALRRTRVLFVDHFGVEGMIRTARIARAAGIPIVADFERNEWLEFPELLGLVDHPIVSREFAERLTGERQPAAALARLWSADRQCVVVTCGAEGCWYQARGEPACHVPAFSVAVVDPTGCGDVFHGAYAAALARGAPVVERIRWASAAAALKATQPGGQAGIPSRVAVAAFLKERP
jgi:sulfofructose kinase